jgi:hypothetical protein
MIPHLNKGVLRFWAKDQFEKRLPDIVRQLIDRIEKLERRVKELEREEK